MKAKLIFCGPNGKKYGLTGLTDEIKKFIDEDASSFYSLIIGTDSQAKKISGSVETAFVTAIVIYRKGKGARYFWKKVKELKRLVLRDKIYEETLFSLDVAGELVPIVREEISPAKYDLEIHVDVGSLGPTRAMIREVVGMVTGNGYVAKTKPESWGASSVADKYT